jgi:hypothetical protein
MQPPIEVTIQTLVAISNSALELQLELDMWERRLRAGKETSDFYVPRYARTIESPEIDDLGNIFPISYNFPNLDAASALIQSEMIQIFLSSLFNDTIEKAYQFPIQSPNLTGFESHNLEQASIEVANRICQSICWE